jgi:hypothetical protein
MAGVSMRTRQQSSPTSRRRLALAASAALAGAVLPVTGLLAGPAAAAPAPSCAPSGSNEVCTFAYNGSPYSWMVPTGVTTMTVVAAGAAGQGSGASSGGDGGEVTETFTGTIGGQTVSLYTGKLGGFGSSVGTVGVGGTGSVNGGNGGSSTVLILGGNLIWLDAAGGGGAGAFGDGGNGGTSSAPNGLAGGGGNPGQGGSTTASAGGIPGSSGACGTAALPGGFGSGGNGATSCAPLAGGGGGADGNYGGGGGGIGSGGGGGSAWPAAVYALNGITETPEPDSTLNNSNGYATITYPLQTGTTTVVHTSPNPSRYGQTVTLTATVSPTDGGGTITFQDNGSNISDSCTGRVPAHLTGSTYTASCTNPLLPGGTDDITAVYSGDSGYAGSTSNPVDQVVDAASTRLRTSFTETRAGFTVYATLTSDGRPVTGQDISFTTDPYPAGHSSLCTAATGSDGTATCHLSGSQARAFERAWGAYTARYAGDPPDYTGSSASDPGVFF